MMALRYCSPMIPLRFAFQWSVAPASHVEAPYFCFVAEYIAIFLLMRFSMAATRRQGFTSCAEYSNSTCIRDGSPIAGVDIHTHADD